MESGLPNHTQLDKITRGRDLQTFKILRSNFFSYYIDRPSPLFINIHSMELSPLADNKYIPLVDTYSNHNTKLPNPNSASLLSSSPEEIQRNILAWREQQQRIHIVV